MMGINKSKLSMHMMVTMSEFICKCIPENKTH